MLAIFHLVAFLIGVGIGRALAMLLMWDGDDDE